MNKKKELSNGKKKTEGENTEPGQGQAEEILKENPKVNKENNERARRVKFKNTCIGSYGNFYEGKEYDLTAGQYELLKTEVI